MNAGGLQLKCGDSAILVGTDDDIEIDTSIKNTDITLNAGTGEGSITAKTVEIGNSKFTRNKVEIAKNVTINA
jgi:hypothetical protein